MQIIYSLGIRLYWITVILASVFNKKAKQFVLGRKGWHKKLINGFNSRDGKVIWMHVSSLGEFEQGRPLIEKIKNEHSHCKIVLTFFSPSGYEIRKNYDQADYICYLPLDTKGNAQKFLSHVKPDYTLFVKYDFWSNFIYAAKKQGSEIFLISGLFRKNQVFFKWYGKWYRKLLRRFNTFFLQDENSAKLLQSIGLNNSVVCGDSRMDRVIEISEKGNDIELIKEFSKNSFIIIGGSTWPPDENLLFEYLKNSPEKIKYIIAPHDISKSHIQLIQQNSETTTLLFSEANSSNIHNSQVLIIDSIGLLSTLYRYGDMAYIGGGFGVSIHNTLEAAVYGIPIIFGPKYHKFKEAVDMINCNAAFTVSNSKDLESIFNSLIINKDYCSEIGKNAYNYIRKMSGATGTIFACLDL